MKVVVNDCYGGFGLSPKAYLRIGELLGKQVYFFSLCDHAPLLPEKGYERHGVYCSGHP